MKITVSLNTTSVDTAIKQVEDYQKKLKEKLLEIARRLAEVGRTYALASYEGESYYHGDKDITVEVVKTENGYKILAIGKEVCFLEFGAGVFYNGSESYPGVRPSGISKIGEFGKGHGKQNTWYFSSGENGKTHGNPPTASLYWARKEMEKELPRIVKEVFEKND